MVHFFISKRVSLYFAVSDFVRQRLYLTHHVGSGKVKTIHLGVNLERFKPMGGAAAKKALGLPDGKRIFCTVAALIPEKGLQVLFEALSLLLAERKGTAPILVIAGEGPYRGELHRRAHDLGITGHIRFLGKRNDIHAVIVASDIVVVPSVWEEAFGLVIAEAMACAKPVIASDTGGIPELVSSGRTGITVEPCNVRELANALRALIDNQDKAHCMGKAGREKAIKEFNMASYIGKISDMYDSVVGRKNTG